MLLALSSSAGVVVVATSAIMASVTLDGVVVAGVIPTGATHCRSQAPKMFLVVGTG